MMSTRGVTSLLLLTLIIQGSSGATRYLIKMNVNASRNEGNDPWVAEDLARKSPTQMTDSKTNEMDNDQVGSNVDRRSSLETSTFNPDVLNKFLEEYATKMKSTTEKNYKYPFTVIKPQSDSLELEVDDSALNSGTTIGERNSTEKSHNATFEEELKTELNDTLKRNKHWSSNSHEDRNGWVTLEAIPWSKSKISKWQANQNTQRPWPDQKPWEKPNGGKPLSASYPPRPNYENNKPWYDKPKPHWPEDLENEKLWYPDRPNQPSRPTYFDDNKFDTGNNPNYAQKWPPEKPWDKYSDSYKQEQEIITDNRPANFPNSWDRLQTSKPTYNYDRFSDKINHEDDTANDWKLHNFNNYRPPLEELNGRPSNFPRPINHDRPNFSQYQYSTEHPQSHPSSGDGEWVLLSTNRGYSKSRQRSIKIEAPNANTQKTSEKKPGAKKEEADPAIPVVTSHRQVRLTVLPSVNGTNTTTSHGGMLEVEKTFKTVDQSQKEYEREKLSTVPTVFKRRPTRNTLGGQPSSSAILAAVGAGMLPATMAMVIPMMLGRKKRSIVEHTLRKVDDVGDELSDLADRINNQRTKFVRM